MSLLDQGAVLTHNYVNWTLDSRIRIVVYEVADVLISQ